MLIPPETGSDLNWQKTGFSLERRQVGFTFALGYATEETLVMGVWDDSKPKLETLTFESQFQADLAICAAHLACIALWDICAQEHRERPQSA